MITIPDCERVANFFQSLTPADLFVELWGVASAWDEGLLLKAQVGVKKPLLESMTGALEVDSQEQATKDLIGKARSRIESQCEENKAVGFMAMMLAINEIFRRIHPRYPEVGPAYGRPKLVPGWLAESRRNRAKFGAYTKNGCKSLIPKGPLCRSSRDPVYDGGVSLASSFDALRVVNATTKQGERTVEIAMKSFTVHRMLGVERAPNNRIVGSESVAFLPIALARTDISVLPQEGGGGFVDFRPSEDLQASSRLEEALKDLGEAVDIALAPEFVFSERESGKAKSVLRSMRSRLCRIALLGSGVEGSKSTSGFYNTSTVVNGCGCELWSQKKVWPALIAKERISELGLPNPDGQNFFQEGTSSGVEVVVSDIEDLGRVVVLICQDIKGDPFSRDVLREYEPDWVLVPILDIGIDPGRWVHRECFKLSEMVGSRFAVVNSMAFADKETYFGMAVGPAQGDASDGDRLRRFVPSTPGRSGSGVISDVARWRDGSTFWVQTEVK